MEQATNQTVSDPKDELDCFHGLHQTEQSRNNPEHPRFGATWNSVGRWWIREEATITGSAEVRGKHRKLALELVDGSINVRLLLPNADIAGKIARWQVIRAIDDNVVSADQIDGIGRAQSGGMNIEFDLGVDPMQTLTRGFHLLATDIARSV